MSSKNRLKGVFFLFMSMLAFALVFSLVTFIIAIAVEYNFSENPVIYTVIYQLLPIGPLALLGFGIYKLFKKSFSYFLEA